MGKCLDGAVREWAAEGFITVTNKVKLNLTGKVLKVQSGRLRGSIGAVSRVTKDGFHVGTNVFYGIAWEKGFTRRAFFVRPVRKSALAFTTRSGARAFSKGHMIPAQSFKARPFILPAIEDSERELRTRLQQIVVAHFNSCFPDVQIVLRLSA